MCEHTWVLQPSPLSLPLTPLSPHPSLLPTLSLPYRKLEEATSQNRDLAGVISKREETIHSNHLCLEEKSRECTHLTNQLEEALEDARLQVCLGLLAAWGQGEAGEQSFSDNKNLTSTSAKIL